MLLRHEYVNASCQISDQGQSSTIKKINTIRALQSHQIIDKNYKDLKLNIIND